MQWQVPQPVKAVVKRLAAAGHQAYLVGGCVRDALLGRDPDDYDVATSATPAEVEALFEQTAPVGAAFGTVLVLSGGMEIHVTTFRADLEYVDGRRPSAVRFSATVEEDLARRDFTVNAVAWDPLRGAWVDPFGGREDLRRRLIRAVGEPSERFREDALRMLRAVRFAATLEFDIEEETWEAIQDEAERARRLSGERVRDELMKILAAPDAGRALWMLVALGLFFIVFPELKGADRLAQAKRGAPTLLDHSIQAAALVPGPPLLRLAALLHDAGKLHTRRVADGGRVVFHGHEKAGADLCRRVMRRLRFSRAQIERAASLVEMHMAVTQPLTKKALRRWVDRFGEGWVRDLLALGRADAMASGFGDENPHIDRLEEALAQVAAERGAFSRRHLKVDGRDVMRELGIPPGPRVGLVLEKVYDAVLEDPSLNEREKLLAVVRRLGGELEGKGASEPKPGATRRE